MTITEDIPRARLPTDDLHGIAGLVSWFLAQRRLAVRVVLPDGYVAAPAGAVCATLLLKTPLCLGDALCAVRYLLDHRRRWVLLYTAGPQVYREELSGDAASGNLRVRRRFHQHGRTPQRRHLVGILIRGAADHGTRSTPFPLWRVVHSWRQQDSSGHAWQVQPLTPSHSARSALLTELSAETIADIACDLAYPDRGGGVYARSGVELSASAELRGPLIIERSIGPDEIHIGPGWIDTLVGPVSIGDAAPVPRGLPYFVGPRPRSRPVQDALKRIFDVHFAVFALLVTLPITLVVALLIKVSDWGPVFFVHQREGLHGRPFGCMKFRTMIRNAEALKEKLRAANQVDGPQFKIADDPRITPIGRFIRRTNIDELPQFLNVLLGQMSVVGPRPSPFKENQLCPPWREARLSVKPGITGLWQVSRSRQRGAADFQEWIYYDTQYVERRSFWLDVKILLLTIKEILGRGQ